MRGSYTNKGHCPETSKDANGLTGIVGLRLYLIWLRFFSTLYSAKAKLGESMFYNGHFITPLLLGGVLFMKENCLTGNNNSTYIFFRKRQHHFMEAAAKRSTYNNKDSFYFCH